MENTIKKNIRLPKGGELEVEFGPKFLDIVKKQFNLPSTLEVNDDHIRMYFWGSFNNAVEKAERQGEFQ